MNPRHFNSTIFLLIATCLLRAGEDPSKGTDLILNEDSCVKITNVQNSESPFSTKIDTADKHFPSNKYTTTHTVHTITQQDIRRLPFRRLQEIISLETGALIQDGVLHVRGGRAGETAYFLNGFKATNPLTNQELMGVIPEAVEQIEFHTGAYSAEYGGGNSALVRTALRTGGPTFEANLDVRTDNFVPVGDEFLGTTSYGYSNYVLTLGGPMPLLPKIRFFAAAQYQYLGNQTPSFVEPFRFDNLTDDGFTGRMPGEPLPGPIEYARNYLPENWRKNSIVQGTLTYDASDALRFQLTGSYQHLEAPSEGYNFYSSLYNYFNLDRNPIKTSKSLLLGLKAIHRLSPSTFYEVGISYSSTSSKTVDPVFGDDWMSYADSLDNAELGYTGWRSRYWGPRSYSTITNFEMEAPGTPPDAYEKYDQSHVGAFIDFTSRLSKQWTLKVGAHLEEWDLRYLGINDLSSLMEAQFGIHGNLATSWENDRERRIILSKYGSIDYYGYDIDGNELNQGPNGPRKPLFASFYLQNNLIIKDITINAGLRIERIDLKIPRPEDEANLPIDPNLSYILEDELIESEPCHYILPRLGLSYPLTNRTFLYGAFGQYVQTPRLNIVYNGLRFLNDAYSDSLSNAYAGFDIKPEKTTHLEVGITHTFFNKLTTTLTGFYKKFTDQLRYEYVYSTGMDNPNNGDFLYFSFLNQAEGEAKGLELTLELQRTKGLYCRANIACSNSEGNASDTRTSDLAERILLQIQSDPIHNYGFNQPFYGSVIADYFFQKEKVGKILGNSGVNLIFTFSKGHNYTKFPPVRNLGASTNPFITVYPMLDPEYSPPEERLNRSITPWIWNIDLVLKKIFPFKNYSVAVYLHVLNLLNTKHVLNVYPVTGVPDNDGWLDSPFAASFTSIPNYFDFYESIINQNRWWYQMATGNDIYGTPRQIRLGVNIEFK